MTSTTRLFAARSRLALVACLAASAVSLAACTSTDGTGGSGSATAPAGSAQATSGGGTIAGSATSVPGPKNDIVKRKTVSLTGCQATPTGASMTGSVDNETGDTVPYQIQVTFTNEHATDLQTVNVTVQAKPKTKTTFTAEGSFPTNPQVKCVLGAIS